MELENIKVWVVDDEEDIRDFLSLILSKAGAAVKTAKNGEEVLAMAQIDQPQILILDKLMPLMDGITACKELRKLKNFRLVKIIILSAISDDDSQIEGLDIGADDYLVKPIRSSLLISKIKAQLRQVPVGNKSDILTYKHIQANRSKFVAFIDDREVVLPKKEFELLYLLMSQPDNVFRREEILESVWGKDIYIGDRTIDVHIRKLREKIGDDYFKTIKGIGYKFVAF